MPQPTRAKTLEEVEEEVEALGLTNETAAAIVRLANTLKKARKLRAEHIELLTPGRRIHPPSPLSQPVWKQADTEDLPRPDQEAEVCCLDEMTSSGAAGAAPPETSDPNSLDDVSLSNIDATALTNVISRVDDISLSQEHHIPSEPPNTAPSPENAEENADLSEKDSSKC